MIGEVATMRKRPIADLTLVRGITLMRTDMTLESAFTTKGFVAVRTGKRGFFCVGAIVDIELGLGLTGQIADRTDVGSR